MERGFYITGEIEQGVYVTEPGVYYVNSSGTIYRCEQPARYVRRYVRVDSLPPGAAAAPGLAIDVHPPDEMY